MSNAASGSGRVHFLTFNGARLGLLPSGHLCSSVSGSRRLIFLFSAQHASGRRRGSCCNAAAGLSVRSGGGPVRSGGGSVLRRLRLAATCGTSADNFLPVLRRSPLRSAPPRLFASSCPRARVPLSLSCRSDSSSALAPLARAASPARFTRSSRAKRNAAVQVTASVAAASASASASASRLRAPVGGSQRVGNYFDLLLISLLLRQSGTEPTSLPGWVQICYTGTWRCGGADAARSPRMSAPGGAPLRSLTEYF